MHLHGEMDHEIFTRLLYVSPRQAPRSAQTTANLAEVLFAWSVCRDIHPQISTGTWRLKMTVQCYAESTTFNTIHRARNCHPSSHKGSLLTAAHTYGDNTVHHHSVPSKASACRAKSRGSWDKGRPGCIAPGDRHPVSHCCCSTMLSDDLGSPSAAASCLKLCWSAAATDRSANPAPAAWKFDWILPCGGKAT